MLNIEILIPKKNVVVLRNYIRVKESLGKPPKQVNNIKVSIHKLPFTDINS